MESKQLWEFIKEKGLEEEFEKFKEVPLVEFKVVEDHVWSYRILAYVNGHRTYHDMIFNDNAYYWHKISEFNKMIQKVYIELGIRATRKEQEDGDIIKYGFDIIDVLRGNNIGPGLSFHEKATSINYTSIDKEKTQIIYDALNPHKNYLMEAFGIK